MVAYLSRFIHQPLVHIYQINEIYRNLHVSAREMNNDKFTWWKQTIVITNQNEYLIAGDDIIFMHKTETISMEIGMA